MTEMTTGPSLGPAQPLPHLADFANSQEYVDSLLELVGQDGLLRSLCGGVHILDFFTSDPPIYDRMLPADWRKFFAETDIIDVLDLLMREDLSDFSVRDGHDVGSNISWRNGPWPPTSLIEYIAKVRKHLLIRESGQTQCYRNRAMRPAHKLSRFVALGMNVKKVHEVGIFASYLNELVDEISEATNEPVSHLVDFGSGQNYLGRALASEPYNRDIVAIESKQANAERAKQLDVLAKLAVKEKILRNKKAFRAKVNGTKANGTPKVNGVPKVNEAVTSEPVEESSSAASTVEAVAEQALSGAGDLTTAPEVESPYVGFGKVQYVDHRISDGNLRNVIEHMPTAGPKNLMIMSLHSCGNLVHHGLRSMTLNPEVKAVAMVGCCYNLVTERLGPADGESSETPAPSDEQPRLSSRGEACDPHGFPMSERFLNYFSTEGSSQNRGIRLNTTSRMMAVQAPSNWGLKDSGDFFPRHYFRALLQRILMDRGVVGPPRAEFAGGSSAAGHSSGGTPIYIGSMRKGCYDNFVAYVRAAVAKLIDDPEVGHVFQEKMSDITDEEILRYDREYIHRKPDLSAIWSLMAFSAGVIEAAIVVDRWLWLREQKEVAAAWVEPLFDYRLSPRNLVVVGVKKPETG
jgi:hypothetical protein